MSFRISTNSKLNKTKTSNKNLSELSEEDRLLFGMDENDSSVTIGNQKAAQVPRKGHCIRETNAPSDYH